jgi:hypothetical protein
MYALIDGDCINLTTGVENLHVSSCGRSSSVFVRIQLAESCCGGIGHKMAHIVHHPTRFHIGLIMVICLVLYRDTIASYALGEKILLCQWSGPNPSNP